MYCYIYRSYLFWIISNIFISYVNYIFLFNFENSVSDSQCFNENGNKERGRDKEEGTKSVLSVLKFWRYYI
jgi:hypothetical protein